MGNDLIVKVFVGLFVTSEIRRGMAIACLAAWRKLGIRPITQTPIEFRWDLSLRADFFVGTKDTFQKDRRVHADKNGEEFYIVADDDCLPLAEFLPEAIRILKDHKDFAILSLKPQNAFINKWTPPAEANYTPFEDEEVEEHFSVGGIRVCHRGALENWPPLEGKAYDTAQCEALRKNKWRVGFYKNIFMSHLGEGFSTL